LAGKGLKIILGAGILFGLFKLSDLFKRAHSAKQVADNLMVDVQDLSLSPLSFNLVLTNQTKQTMTITSPVIEFFLNEKAVAYSEPNTQNYTINPLATTKIRIKLKIKQQNALSLFKIGGKKKIKYSLYANKIFVKNEMNL